MPKHIHQIRFCLETSIQYTFCLVAFYASCVEFQTLFLEISISKSSFFLVYTRGSALLILCNVV